MSSRPVKQGNLFTQLVQTFSWAEIKDRHNKSSKRAFDNPIKWEKEAIVDEAIEPGKAGRVSFQGSWWPARCEEEITLLPGQIVYVIGQRNITLIVEPLSSNLF